MYNTFATRGVWTKMDYKGNDCAVGFSWLR